MKEFQHISAMATEENFKTYLTQPTATPKNSRVLRRLKGSALSHDPSKDVRKDDPLRSIAIVRQRQTVLDAALGVRADEPSETLDDQVP